MDGDGDADAAGAVAAPTPNMLDLDAKAAARAARFGTVAAPATPQLLESLSSAVGSAAVGAARTSPTGYSVPRGRAGAARAAARAAQTAADATATGDLDVLDPEQRAKAAARAARFGTSVFDWESERAAHAGLSADEVRVRRERRARAARFGKADELDAALARSAFIALGSVRADESAGPLPEGYVLPEESAVVAAVAALEAADAAAGAAATLPSSAADASAGGGVIAGGGGESGDGGGGAGGGGGGSAVNDAMGDGAGAGGGGVADGGAVVAASFALDVDPMADEAPPQPADPSTTPMKPDFPATVRQGVIHLRAYAYLPAATGDVVAFFAPLRPSRIEWLNGTCVNVVFEDVGTASRAMELFSEPVPVVEGVPVVHPAWRTCLKPIIK
jgi:hypothetical protein